MFLKIYLLTASNYNVVTFPLTEPKYIPWFWCACLHTCWKFAYQTRFWNHMCCSRFGCYQGYRFELGNILRCIQHWTLPCYSWSPRRPVTQSASSTCYDPKRWRGIAHQRSLSTESWPACWWQWSWSVGRSSYQGKSWRRVCSSRSVTWSHDGQSQSFLLEDWSRSCCSRVGNCNEKLTIE